MYVSMSRLRIAPERAAELVTAFRGRLGAVDGHDGFVDLQVWQSDRDRGEILMVSRWRDRAAFREYMRSEEHRISHDRIDPELDAQFGPRPVNAVRAAEIVTARFGGRVVEAELDEENGRPIWEMGLAGAAVDEVDVDAINGAVLGGGQADDEEGDDD